MAQFYRGTSTNVIGAPARVLIAASTYQAPSRLSEIVSLTTYDPNTTYGWVDAGLTRTPTTVQVQADTNQWTNEQFGQFHTVPTNWRGQVSTEFLETDQTHRAAIMMFSSVAAPPTTGEQRTNFAARTSLSTVRVAVMYLDEYGRVHAIVFPKCQWDGSALSQTIARGEAIAIPMTFTAYPDDQVIDSVSGQAVLRYDLDQG